MVPAGGGKQIYVGADTGSGARLGFESRPCPITVTTGANGKPPGARQGCYKHTEARIISCQVHSENSVIGLLLLQSVLDCHSG